MGTATPHVAVVAFPISSHGSILLTVARALATEAASTDAAGATFSFLSTAASFASLGAADGCPENLLLVEVPEGVPAGEPTPPVMQQVGMFVAAAEAGGVRTGLEAAEKAAGGVRVSCVVSDAFLWMAADAAAEIGVPWVPMWTADGCCLLAHLHTDELRRTIGTGDQADSRADDLLTAVPGLEHHRVRDLPEGVVSGDFDHVISLLLHHTSTRLPRAAAAAANAFPGLDPPGVEAALAAAFPAYLPIGPIHLLSTTASKPTVSDPRGCFPWLDRQVAGSVVYVAFGTVACPPPDELRELALGLEASGAPFIWSLKESAWPLLPRGFLDRNNDRGLVVGWAPQVEVLNHDAVGAFVCHAGWCSVLEAIGGEVPLACRPFFGDHVMNARSVTHAWGIGVRFDGDVMTRAGVAAAVSELLKGEEGKKMRARAKELNSKLVKAFEPDGAAKQNFERLVKIVCGI